MAAPPRLLAFPLAVWERDGLMAALRKAELPVDNIDAPDRLFWRFESQADVPVGFGGLEICGRDGLLHSLVTLPPLRCVGFGSAMVAALEQEAQLRGCRAAYVFTPPAHAGFFARLGYVSCARRKVPKEVRASGQFAALAPARGAAMVKTLAP